MIGSAPLKIYCTHTVFNSLVSLFFWDTSEEVVKVVLIVPVRTNQEVNVDNVVKLKLDGKLGPFGYRDFGLFFEKRLQLIQPLAKPLVPHRMRVDI